MTELDNLESIPLRKAWQNEATDFTPWLAKPENLAILCETLGIQLQLKSTEKSVGSFSADLVCVDTVKDSDVVIENQLDPTDHKHIGQLLTYAAGLKATTVVWIAQEFRKEHASVLKWLNDVTEDGVDFFGLEIELWRIGESKPAPKFNIVSRPDSWSREVKTATNTDPNDPTKALNVQYWSGVREALDRDTSGVKSMSPKPVPYAFYSIGRTNFRLRASFSSQKNELQVALLIWGENAKAFGEMLFDQRDEIHNELGDNLAWTLPPTLKSTVISRTKPGVDPSNTTDWTNQSSWFVGNLNAFDNAFRRRVKELNFNNYVPATPGPNDIDEDDIV